MKRSGGTENRRVAWLRQREIETELAARENPGGGFPPAWACGTFVHEICWLTLKAYAYNQGRLCLVPCC